MCNIHFDVKQTSLVPAEYIRVFRTTIKISSSIIES